MDVFADLFTGPVGLLSLFVLAFCVAMIFFFIGFYAVKMSKPPGSK